MRIMMTAGQDHNFNLNECIERMISYCMQKIKNIEVAQIKQKAY